MENIVGKGENAGYQHFLLFPQFYQKPLSKGHLKSGLCGKKFNEVQMMICVTDWVEKIVEKGENAGY